MRILYISHYFFPFEGAGSIVTYEIIRYFAKRGHYVDLFTPEALKYPKHFGLKSANKVSSWGFERSVSGRIGVFKIKTYLPYGLSVFFGYFFLALRLLKILKYKKYNAVISQFHTFHFAPFLGFLASRLQRVPYVLKTHNILFESSGSFFFKLYNHFSFGINRLLLQKADLVTVISPELKEESANYYNLPRNKIFVIPNGISPTNNVKNVSRQMKKPQSLNDKTVLLFMGTLAKSDNLDVMIEAMPFVSKENPDSVLLIIGDGEHRRHLENLVKKKKIEQIFFLGRIPHERVSNLIKIADLTIGKLSSKRNYEPIGSLPMRVLEYMLLGKPVITSKWGITSMLIKHKYNGWLLNEITPESVSAEINFLLKNKEIRYKLGENARESVLRIFTWEKICRQFERLLFQLTNEQLHFSAATNRKIRNDDD